MNPINIKGLYKKHSRRGIYRKSSTKLSGENFKRQSLQKKTSLHTRFDSESRCPKSQKKQKKGTKHVLLHSLIYPVRNDIVIFLYTKIRLVITHLKIPLDMYIIGSENITINAFKDNKQHPKSKAHRN